MNAKKKLKSGVCADKRCLYPQVFPALKIDHQPQRNLLQQLRKIKGIKKVFVGSGLRYDMVLADHQQGFAYLQDVVRHHTSGQMKIAPEHTENRVLGKMGKPGKKSLLKFRELFYKLTQDANKPQFLTYYLIAAHPGCEFSDMQAAGRFVNEKLNITPQQVQIFTPLPSTYSTLMYYTEMDPFTRQPIFVEKDPKKRAGQKNILTGNSKKFGPKSTGPKPAASTAKRFVNKNSRNKKRRQRKK